MLRSVYNYWKGANLTAMNKTMVYKGLRKVVLDIIAMWVVKGSVRLFNIMVPGPSITLPVLQSQEWTRLSLLGFYTLSTERGREGKTGC